MPGQVKAGLYNVFARAKAQGFDVRSGYNDLSMCLSQSPIRQGPLFSRLQLMQSQTCISNLGAHTTMFTPVSESEPTPNLQDAVSAQQRSFARAMKKRQTAANSSSGAKSMSHSAGARLYDQVEGDETVDGAVKSLGEASLSNGTSKGRKIPIVFKFPQTLVTLDIEAARCEKSAACGTIR